MSAVFPCSWSDPAHEVTVEPFCPQCDAPLELHQPDSELPHRLLAVCGSCKAWYISDTYGMLLKRIPIEDDVEPRRPVWPTRGVDPRR